MCVSDSDSVCMYIYIYITGYWSCMRRAVHSLRALTCSLVFEGSASISHLDSTRVVYQALSALEKNDKQHSQPKE